MVRVVIILIILTHVSECEHFLNYTLPILTNNTSTDQVRCHLPSSCDIVRCCVYIAPVKRHAQVVLLINTCSYQMEAEIDNLKVTRNLFTYTWGRIYTILIWCLSIKYIQIQLIKNWVFSVGTMEKMETHGVLGFGYVMCRAKNTNKLYNIMQNIY